MQRQHQLVIAAAPAAGDAQLVIQPGLAGQMRADARQESAREILERLAHLPVARRGRRDIGEEAQDAPSPHGPRRKGIDMQQPVVADLGIAAALHLHRAIAGAGALDIAIGQQVMDQLRRARAEAFDHRLQRVGVAAGQRCRLQLAGVVIQARYSWPCRRRRAHPGTAFRRPRSTKGRCGKNSTAPRSSAATARAFTAASYGPCPVGQRQGLQACLSVMAS